jgi:hypothetical protein
VSRSSVYAAWPASVLPEAPIGGTAATTVGSRDAFSHDRGQTPCATWEPHKVLVPIGLPRVELRCRVVRQGVVKLPER